MLIMIYFRKMQNRSIFTHCSVYSKTNINSDMQFCWSWQRKKRRRGWRWRRRWSRRRERRGEGMEIKLLCLCCCWIIITLRSYFHSVFNRWTWMMSMRKRRSLKREMMEVKCSNIRQHIALEQFVYSERFCSDLEDICDHNYSSYTLIALTVTLAECPEV